MYSFYHLKFITLSKTAPHCASYSTRYFTAQNGKELKWKHADGRMEVGGFLIRCLYLSKVLIIIYCSHLWVVQCYNGRNVIATYEQSGEKRATARLTIKHLGLPICTEIVTALLLNRMALAFGWPDNF